MKNILIAYNFSQSCNDDFNVIAGRDRINLWVAILIKKLIEGSGLVFLFPRDFCGQKIDLELHVNFSPEISCASRKIGLFMENPLIEPNNSRENCSKYDFVISSDESLEGESNVVNSNLPCWDEDGPRGDNIFGSGALPRESFSMICSNKYFRRNIPFRDLYLARREVIRFFEDCKPSQLSLFGSGWNIPRSFLMYPRLAKKFASLKFEGNINSYKGKCSDKASVLSQSTFNFCYENCDYPNYVSEKLFDALVAGVVPIYDGAQSGGAIPTETHINASAFSCVGALHEYCRNSADVEIRSIIDAGAAFLNEDGKKFSHQSYAKTVMQCIKEILHA